MKKLAVISGKGGTGKTTFVANMAFLAGEVVLADCDVDAPNLHLLMSPEITHREDYYGASLAVKDDSLCNDCGTCRELCHFGADDKNYEIKDYKCEGCGLCVARCPENALSLVEHKTGEIYYSQACTGPMVHARLEIGAENSGRLVSRVKKEAEKQADNAESELIIVDGSPGVGCPVIASLGGVDGALIISEPTKSGISDMERIVELLDHFAIPGYMVINKYDINTELTQHIADYCQENDIPLLGKTPFDESVVRAMEQGEFLVRFPGGSPAARSLREIWKLTKETLFKDENIYENHKHRQIQHNLGE